ncbi:cuticle collagen 19-like isoform X4 [Bacillus rossius redtenbacheri]|uniref:cuticle collagen 19-like isoform X4 n=1 Tax=Bacillus rossius redtenbacheri TaxID=93214 RepID=UPI002FDE2C2D
MEPNIPNVKLNNGLECPALGIGTYESAPRTPAGGADRSHLGREGRHRPGLPPHRLRLPLPERGGGGRGHRGQDRAGRRRATGVVRHREAVEHVPPAGAGAACDRDHAQGPGPDLPRPLPHPLAHHAQGRGRTPAQGRRRPEGPVRRLGPRRHVAGHGAAGGEEAGPVHRRVELQQPAGRTDRRRGGHQAGHQPGGVPPVPDPEEAEGALQLAGHRGDRLLAARRSGPQDVPGRRTRPHGRPGDPEDRGLAQEDSGPGRPALPDSERQRRPFQIREEGANQGEHEHLRLRAVRGRNDRT